MTDQDVSKLKNRISRPPSVMGKWRARRALQKLLGNESIEAARALTNLLQESLIPSLREQLISSLLSLQSQKMRESLCAVWVETRDPQLETIIAQAEWEVRRPTSLKVMVQMLRTRYSKYVDTGAGQVKWLIEAANDPDDQVSKTARSALQNLKTETAVERLCDQWFKTRKEELAEAIIKGRCLPVKPDGLRVAIACLTSNRAGIFDKDVQDLCVLLNDADPRLRANAEKFLRSLNTQEAKEALCQWVMWHASPIAESIAGECSIVPGDRRGRALFFYVTGQRDAYEKLDKNRNVMRTIYNESPPDLRARIDMATEHYKWGNVFPSWRDKKGGEG